MEIELTEGMDIEFAIKKFARLVSGSGILKELRLRALCPSRGLRRKQKEIEAARRRRKLELRRQRYDNR